MYTDMICESEDKQVTVNEKQQLIYKETANILDELAFVYGIKNLYETMCSYINVSKHINNMGTLCSDIDENKVNKLNSLKEKSTVLIRDELYSILRTFIMGEGYEEVESGLLELLFNIGYSSDIEVRTLDDMLSYNKEFHLDRFDDFSIDRFRSIAIGRCNYTELKIDNDSFVLLYPPFKSQNILEEKFKYIEMYDWIRKIIDKQHTNNIHVFILAKEMPEDFIVYSDFSDKFKLNKKDTNNLRLFVHKDSIIVNEDNSELSF